MKWNEIAAQLAELEIQAKIVENNWKIALKQTDDPELIGAAKEILILLQKKLAQHIKQLNKIISDIKSCHDALTDKSSPKAIKKANKIYEMLHTIFLANSPKSDMNIIRDMRILKLLSKTETLQQILKKNSKRRNKTGGILYSKNQIQLMKIDFKEIKRQINSLIFKKEITNSEFESEIKYINIRINHIHNVIHKIPSLEPIKENPESLPLPPFKVTNTDKLIQRNPEPLPLPPFKVINTDKPIQRDQKPLPLPPFKVTNTVKPIQRNPELLPLPSFKITDTAKPVKKESELDRLLAAIRFEYTEMITRNGILIDPNKTKSKCNAIDKAFNALRSEAKQNPNEAEAICKKLRLHIKWAAYGQPLTNSLNGDPDDKVFTLVKALLQKRSRCELFSSQTTTIVESLDIRFNNIPKNAFVFGKLDTNSKSKSVDSTSPTDNNPTLLCYHLQ